MSSRATARVAKRPAMSKDERLLSRIQDVELDPESWRGDTGWKSLGSPSSGVSVTSGTQQYRRIGGIVYVQTGLLNSGFAASASSIFTLPAGFRPYQTLRFKCGGLQGTGVEWEFDVQANGTLVMFNTGGGAGISFAMDCSFPADN